MPPEELTETVRGSSSEIRMLPSHAERLLRHVPQVTPGFRASVDLDLGNQRVHFEEPGALPKTTIAPKTGGFQ